jgi:site-specific recombinase XerD
MRMNDELRQAKPEIESVGFTDYLLGKGYSSATTVTYQRDAARFKQWAEKENVPIGAVNYADVLHYIQIKKKSVKQSTISIIVNSLKHYFNYLNACGEISKNPTNQIKIRGIKRSTLYHILGVRELEQLYESFEIPDENDPNKNQNWFRTSHLTAKRNKVILGLMIWQGLNTMELARLTVKDLKLRQGKVFIAGSRRSNQRTLKLESVQIMDLMEYMHTTRKEFLALSKKQTDGLFLSSGSGKGFNNLMQKFMQKLKHKNPNIDNTKQIRTSVITHWLKIHNLKTSSVHGRSSLCKQYGSLSGQ